MSVLSISELSAAEQTAVAMDRLNQTLLRNVVPLRQPTAADREAGIRAAVLERCKALRLCTIQADDALAAAQAERAFGGSAAMAVRAGVAKAERSAAAMRVVRTRYGSRPDRDPPCAA